MKFGVQTGGLEELFGIDGAYRMIAEAGFDAVDANIDHLCSCSDIINDRFPKMFFVDESEVIEAARPWKEKAEKYGLQNYQAHAPFPSLVAGNEDVNEKAIEMLRKTIIACDYIDCRNLIIHPFFLPYDQHVSAQREWEENIDRYSRLIPTAKEHGVTICLENMFSGYNGKLYSACCSDIPTACDYIDTLNEIAGPGADGAPVFGFCLDIGHLLLTGQDVLKAMSALDSRICAFHVHDNNGINDQHLAPYMGVQDWDAFASGLAAINYQKTMCFETFNVMNVIDPSLAPSMLKWINECGHLFAKKAGL